MSSVGLWAVREVFLKGYPTPVQVHDWLSYDENLSVVFTLILTRVARFNAIFVGYWSP